VQFQYISDCKVESPFQGGNGGSLQGDQGDGSKRKIDELIKELELRQAEYASNLREREN